MAEYQKQKSINFQRQPTTQDQQIQQQRMLNQQLSLIINEQLQELQKNKLTYKNVSLWSDSYHNTKHNQSNKSSLRQNQQLNKHNFSIYADKLLIHLVIEEEFDFSKISQTLQYTFHYEPNKKYTEQNCRERWYELHRDRLIGEKVRQKQMENKRIMSIMSFNDPFILYNIDEKLHKMEKDQSLLTKNNKQKSIITQKTPNQFELPQDSQQQHHQYIEIKYDGYNIFKDSIRKIDNMQKYNQLHQHMRQALKKASESIQLEKPMLYTPYYDRLEQFQVLQQELTNQKMQQLMSHPIEMELMERQLKVINLNESKNHQQHLSDSHKYESKIKKQIEKKIKQERIKNQEQFEIEQDWDEYQSD